MTYLECQLGVCWPDRGMETHWGPARVLESQLGGLKGPSEGLEDHPEV